jgi:TonB family protein
MAPILKELEAAPAASPNAAAPPSARPQPVALEIPVTVNGARTVDGSDKRAPFSESTQTVLVFPHGAVIRITTPLVPGQLVFLTNEKTKKEVVCQVVKSKSSGGTGAYVELQFTEPSASFWGLQIPGASSAPPAPRLVPSPAPLAPKPAAPVAPVAVKPPVAPIPVAPKPPAPVAISTPAVMPVAPPPPPVAAVPVIPIPGAVQPVAPVSAAPPAPLISAPPPPVAHTEPAVPAAPDIHSNANPVPPLRDYSKQIEAIFSAAPVPAPPAAPEQHHAPLPPAPSTEHLKEEATRLQAQLSSLLFTQPTSAPPVVPAAPPVHLDAPKTVSDVALEPPKSAAPIESKPAVPAQKLSSLPLGADEEVKMPSWLAPLSQNSEPAAVESSASSEVAHDHSVSVNSEESYDALVGGAHQRPQTAVFGGQLLGESPASAADSSSGSKKGLFFGLAAAGLLLATGGGWYFLQNRPASPATAAVRSANVPSSSAAAPTSNSAAPSGPSASTVASNRPNSTSVNAETPSRNSAPVVPAPVASAAAAPDSKNSKPTPKNPDPVETAPEKPALGDVHLAAPVVHSADSQQAQADPNALQSIDTKTVPADGDPFAAAAAHHAAPAAPLPVGGDVKEARLIKSVPPEYPTLAKAQHVSGKVQMDALIDASGNVSAVKVLSGPTLLHRAALDAVKQWKYKPAMLDGQATSMHLTVTVEFRNQ